MRTALKTRASQRRQEGPSERTVPPMFHRWIEVPPPIAGIYLIKCHPPLIYSRIPAVVAQGWQHGRILGRAPIMDHEQGPRQGHATGNLGTQTATRTRISFPPPP